MAFKSVFNLFGNNSEFPSDYINYYNQGIKLSKVGKFRNALKFYERAIELNPYVPEVYVEKGIVLFNISSFNESLESFERALKLKGDIKEAFFYKGRILVERARFKEALLCFNSYLKLDSSNSDAFLYKGISLMELGQYVEALESLEESLKLDPNNKKAYIKKASILVSQGNFNEAMIYIDKTLENEKNNSELYCEKGICLYQLKQFDDSLDYLNTALKIDTNCSKALYYKGLIFLNELYKYNEAIACFDKYSSLQENDYRGYLQKAITLIELRKYQEALIVSSAAIKINDKIPELFYEQGLVYLLLSKWEDSLFSLNRALELNADYKEALEKKDYVLKMQARIKSVPNSSNSKNFYEKPVKNNVIKKEPKEEKVDKILVAAPLTESKDDKLENKVSKANNISTPSLQNAPLEVAEKAKEDTSSNIDKPILEKEVISNPKTPIEEPLKKVEKQPSVLNNESKNLKPREDNKISKQKPSIDNNLDEDLKLFKYILEKDSIPSSKIDIKDLIDGQDIIYSIEETTNELDDMDRDSSIDPDKETFNFEELTNFGEELEYNDFGDESNISTNESINGTVDETNSSFDLDNFIISKANFLDDSKPVDPEIITTNKDIEPIPYEDEDLSSFIIDSKASINTNDSFIENPNSKEDIILKKSPIEELPKVEEIQEEEEVVVEAKIEENYIDKLQVETIKPIEVSKIEKIAEVKTEIQENDIDKFQVEPFKPIEEFEKKPIENSIEKPEEKVLFTKYADFNADFKDQDLLKYDKFIDEVHFMPFEEGQNKLWKDVLSLDSWFVFENIYKFKGPYYENINGKLWLLTFTDTAHLSKCLRETYLNPDIITVSSINKLDDFLLKELNKMGIYGLWFNKGQHCWFITLEDLKKLI